MAYTEQQIDDFIAKVKSGSSANGTNGAGGSPWGYTPSQAVYDTVQGIRTGAYKNQGTYANTNDYASTIGADVNAQTAKDPMYMRMLQESMAADQAGNIKRQNDLSANGKQATDEELANMFLYNAFQNMSEDDQNEVFRQLQSDLPYDQKRNPVDITNRFMNWRYGDVNGYDESGNPVRSGGYEARVENGGNIDEDTAFYNEAKADFDKLFAPYKKELMAQGIPEDEVLNYVQSIADKDTILGVAYEGWQSAKNSLDIKNRLSGDTAYGDDIANIVYEAIGRNSSDVPEGTSFGEEVQMNNDVKLRALATEDFDYNQLYAQQNPDAVIGIDTQTGLYIFDNSGIDKTDSRYHLYSKQELEQEKADGFRNAKNNPNAGYFS